MFGAQPSTSHRRPPVPRLAPDRSVHLLDRGLSALCGRTEPAWGPRGSGAVCPGCSAAAAPVSRITRAAQGYDDDSGSDPPPVQVRVDVHAEGCEVAIRGVGVEFRVRYVVRPAP